MSCSLFPFFDDLLPIEFTLVSFLLFWIFFQTEFMQVLINDPFIYTKLNQKYIRYFWILTIYSSN